MFVPHFPCRLAGTECSREHLTRRLTGTGDPSHPLPSRLGGTGPSSAAFPSRIASAGNAGHRLPSRLSGLVATTRTEASDYRRRESARESGPRIGVRTSTEHDSPWGNGATSLRATRCTCTTTCCSSSPFAARFSRWCISRPGRWAHSESPTRSASSANRRWCGAGARRSQPPRTRPSTCSCRCGVWPGGSSTRLIEPPPQSGRLGQSGAENDPRVSAGSCRPRRGRSCRCSSWTARGRARSSCRSNRSRRSWCRSTWRQGRCT